MKHEVASMNTKKALASALRSSMAKKPFSKITVSEIIKECGLNRKTFYYHFQDIYVLLKWMLEQDAIEIVKKFDLIVDYEDAINFLMDYLENNSAVINSAYESIGHDLVKNLFYADLLEVVNKIITASEQKRNKTLEQNYKAFLSQFYTEAFSGIIFDWIRNNKGADRKIVIEYISGTIRASLTGIFEVYGEKI